MKSKGFTLIELLAVIVILAIIALIATPIILNIIDDTKESSKERSKELYLDAVANTIAAYNMKYPMIDLSNTTCDIVEKSNEELGITIGDLACGDNKDIYIKVEMDGEKPKSGRIEFTNGKVVEAKTEISFEAPIVLEPGLYDENNNQKYSWQALIDEGIISVENNVLSGVENGDAMVGKLIIDDSINQISLSAFSGCTKLTSIVIPNSVTNISYEAFSGCTSLTSVILPEKITDIKDYLFSGCTNLTTVVIPESVTSIGEYAFSGCDNLTTINYKGSSDQWQEINFNEFWDNGMPADVTIIHDYQETK